MMTLPQLIQFLLVPVLATVGYCQTPVPPTESTAEVDPSAIDYVDKIAPVPLLIVHGTADGMIPYSQAEALFEKAKEPKTLFKVEDGGHYGSLSRSEGEYRKRMLACLDQVLQEKAKPEYLNSASCGEAVCG